MTETQDDNKPKKTLTLGKKLEVKQTGDKGEQVRQSFSHGRTKAVTLEVKKRRAPTAPSPSRDGKTGGGDKKGPQKSQKGDDQRRSNHGDAKKQASGKNTRGLSREEIEGRMRAIQAAVQNESKEKEIRAKKEAEEAQWRREREEQEQRNRLILEAEKAGQAEKADQTAAHPERKESAPKEMIASGEKSTEKTDVVTPSSQSKDGASSKIAEKPAERPIEKARGKSAEKPEVRSTNPADVPLPSEKVSTKTADRASPGKRSSNDDEGLLDFRRKNAVVKNEVKKPATPAARRDGEQVRKLNRQVLTRALSDEGTERGRSMASLKRHRQKHKAQQSVEIVKIQRDVIIPDAITVSELANRMAVRSADVIKTLMKLGMMVTINQVIDADTAELICTEFGHKFKRVSESDIELGLKGDSDDASQLVHRAPVVTVMGHVDHGKTSLLDALRKTDVVSGEAGGITQHIGAYQITLESGQKITFIDTPGHAAFTEMRARGANVTDIVVLVVAADDGIMEQTVEAINHAKAAKVPIIVAINKIDKPEANVDRVRNELLQHSLVLEELGGDIMAVEVSAKKGIGLNKLEEAILLQAEVLELQANPNRIAEGVVIEAEIDKGRGTVATVLIQRGTLKLGDIFVAGSEWGRVRALVDDHGRRIVKAKPSMPIEVIGFNGVPAAGDEFFVVENEARAREVAEYRQRKTREAKVAASARGNMEQMMNRIAAGEVKELPIVIKSDVQGSLEAITASLLKLSTDEVAIRILHGGVGGINESDITLARASNALVIGFNVRANPQARDLSNRDNVEIKYYSIIYDVLDDLKALLGGMLAPTIKEKYLGSMAIRQIFTVGKHSKIGGCYVLDGLIKRAAKVRLLRDSVVIYEGQLKSLRRFKDEVKEVKESYECGVVIEGYNDIRESDVIECFEMESVSRQL